MRIISVMVSSA